MPKTTGQQPSQKFHTSDKPTHLAERLVTVESQRELDLFSGQWAERVFVKMYVAARSSGLLATISDRDWKTLCTLATYMDSEGYCYPSQAELAKALGCSRQMANERVKSLSNFRFQGQAVLVVVKGEREQGMWSHNGYRVLPLANLGIFDEVGKASTTIAHPKDNRQFHQAQSSEATVSRKLDTVEAKPTVSTTVSSSTVTVPLDTNQIHNKNQIEPETSNVRKAARAQENYEPSTFRLASTEDKSEEERRSRHTGPQPLGEVLKRVALPLPPLRTFDEARGVITNYVADFSVELGDEAKLKASVTRLYNIYRRSGRDLSTFTNALYEARSRTKQASASIKKQRKTSDGHFAGKNKFPYFVATVEDLLGMKDNSPRGSSQDTPSP